MATKAKFSRGQVVAIAYHADFQPEYGRVESASAGGYTVRLYDSDNGDHRDASYVEDELRALTPLEMRGRKREGSKRG